MLLALILGWLFFARTVHATVATPVTAAQVMATARDAQAVGIVSAATFQALADWTVFFDGVYNFTEGAGATAVDDASTNDLTDNGTVGRSSTGALDGLGQYATFDGVNDRLTCADATCTAPHIGGEALAGVRLLLEIGPPVVSTFNSLDGVIKDALGMLFLTGTRH